MADQESGTVRKVAWSVLFPWLILVRCFRIAVQPRQLVLGAAGIFLTLLGWAVLGWLAADNSLVAPGTSTARFCPWVAATSMIPDPDWTPASSEATEAEEGAEAKPAMVPADPRAATPSLAAVGPNRGVWGRLWGKWTGGLASEGGPIGGVWSRLSFPVRECFASQATTSQVAFLALSGLWAIAVWGFFGGLISRSASLQLATRERDHLAATLRFVRTKWRDYVAAPAVPLIGVAVIAVPLAIAGVLLRANVGVLLAGILWPLLLLGGALIAILLFGLAFGWPLMWANVSTEGVDYFDAISRMYNYTYHRPVRYLFYAMVAAVLGVLGWFVVWCFTFGIVAATYWAASWGAGGANVHAVIFGENLSNVGPFGAFLIRFWVECVKLIGVGFLYSYFWTASSAIYLLLRRDVDQTEMDEITPEEEEHPAEELPPIHTDSAGAPIIDDGQKAQEQVSG